MKRSVYLSMPSLPSFSVRRNMRILGTGFFCIFAPFNAAQSLMTSSTSWGSYNLAVLYATFSLTCVITPRIVTTIGARLAMIIGAIPYGLMIFLSLFKSDLLSLFANFAVGLGAPLLWTGQGYYLAQCAIHEANSQESSISAVTAKLNGDFYTLFQANGVVGLLMSSLILSYAGAASFSIVSGSIGLIGVVILMALPSLSDGMLRREGDSTSANGLDGQTCTRTDTTTTTTTGSMDMNNNKNNYKHNDRAIPLLLSDDKQPMDEERGRRGKDSMDSSDEGSHSVSLVETLKLIVNDRKLSLCLPLIFYNGVSLGYIFGVYTLHAVTRGLGISYNGYVMGLGFFLMNAIATKMFGQCISSSSISRSTSMGIAGVLHLAFYLFFILVDVPLNYIKDAEEKGSDEDYTQLHVPQSMTYVVIFCGAAVFAVGDAVWESQLPALLQTFYKHSERDCSAALSANKMVQSLGFACEFILASILTSPTPSAATSSFLSLSELSFLSLILLLTLCAGLVCMGIVHGYYGNVNGEGEHRKDHGITVEGVYRDISSEIVGGERK